METISLQGACELGQVLKGPEPCQYLRDRLATMEFRLFAAIDERSYARLLEAGFRRFGAAIFRPVCEGCSSCIPIRVPTDRFRPSKSQRRILRKNGDVKIVIGEPEADEERLDLYRAFHEERSEKVGWERHEITREDYARTFVENIAYTRELRYRIGGRLAALAYVDLSPGTLNSIYCMRHPDFACRSLGTFDVLVEIGLARRLGLTHLYLGFTVPGCRSMEYKTAFRPAEVLVDGAWRDLGGSGKLDCGKRDLP